ncbi:MBOAT family O-acyltransferase [Pseudobutyrivibrio sp. 49]|uniref:MBOAT family O-acyltransferase n=1 Tax=Pseudobutyrivibrio sp. 49 TaxID=1855344 RepID=UPI0015A176D9|nr:MBOAT family O-acyltransferase [Pseudobutyrivibrio sp. 49]
MFYGWSNPKILLVLILVTIISYVGGLLLDIYNRKAVYVTFFLLEISVLGIYKYTDFLITNINQVLCKTLETSISVNWDIALPVGLSFMVFQACTYLSDVYRRKVSVEKNVIKYATFVAFFPTVLSGPIQKSRNLLPQISSPRAFDYNMAKSGTLLFTWGAFEKIMVANKLSQIYLSVLPDYMNRSSAELLIGAMCFSLYIYADFSSYSDMARGVGKILGIEVGKNFNNPYLSQSTAEFWNRWHMSLNEWFIENLYIPLGGNRKGNIRKYINMLIVFLVSGLWHGAQWHFVVWGLFNGVIVVIGQLIKPFKIFVYKKLNIDEKTESIVLIRRVIVFFLITLTWIFFTSETMDSFSICKRILMFNYFSIFNPDLLCIAGTAVGTFVIVISTILFCKVQIRRQDEQNIYEVYCRQPLFLQGLLVAAIISVCIFGACATDANIDTQFLYFQF